MNKPVSFIAAIMLLVSCSDRTMIELENTIVSIIEDRPARIGVAVITDTGDSLVVNNSDDYPMMSMFKLHEAIAVCRTLEEKGASIDTVLAVSRDELNMQTLSPMLKEYTDEVFDISVRTLMEYLLVDSDNNASNLLFERIVPVAAADSIIASLMPERGFRMSYTEAQMQRDHSLSYLNATSPLSYASLVKKVFTDSLVSAGNQEFIREMMRRCGTGNGRIAAGLPEGVEFAHRTGSGYVNERGEVIAVNDGGYVTLPDGRSYAIAVLVKDFAGPQEDADAAIAEVSKAVYEAHAAE